MRLMQGGAAWARGSDAARRMASPVACARCSGRSRCGVDGARRFRCVIESLSTKVTMFSPKGLPLRATCTMKLKEVKMLAKTDSAG